MQSSAFRAGQSFGLLALANRTAHLGWLRRKLLWETTMDCPKGSGNLLIQHGHHLELRPMRLQLLPNADWSANMVFSVVWPKWSIKSKLERIAWDSEASRLYCLSLIALRPPHPTRPNIPLSRKWAGDSRSVCLASRIICWVFVGSLSRAQKVTHPAVAMVVKSKCRLPVQRFASCQVQKVCPLDCPLS